MIRLIKNGRVIDPTTGVDEVRDVSIADSKISGQTAGDQVPDEEVIDATGCWVIPGIVDLAARFREPGHEHKGSIRSESAAALAGGITNVCLQPDTEPMIDTPAVIELIQQRGQRHNGPHLQTLGAMSLGLQGTQLSEFAALKSAGCAGVSSAGKYIGNNQLMRNIMDYAASLQLKVFLTPEDDQLSEGGLVHEGKVSTRLGLPGIPVAAETAALARDLMLIEATGVTAHFCRLSCAQSVEMLSHAQEKGLPVTADVAIHQLFLTDIDNSQFDSNTHVRPPFRSERDRDALRQALSSGTIQAVCSDHQPHDADAKLAPFGETEPGISTLEVLLPLVMKLVHDNVLQPARAVEILTSEPANILGIDAGTLAPGSQADITIIAPDAPWTFNADKSLSQGKNTPFDQWQFEGQVTHTLVNGELLYQLS